MGSAFMVVAYGYPGVDVWVWDGADVVFTKGRTRYGTPWRSFAGMRIHFGIVGVVLLVFGLHSLMH